MGREYVKDIADLASIGGWWRCCQTDTHIISDRTYDITNKTFAITTVQSYLSGSWVTKGFHFWLFLGLGLGYERPCCFQSYHTVLKIRTTPIDQQHLRQSSTSLQNTCALQIYGTVGMLYITLPMFYFLLLYAAKRY